jgi:hypothetical protein
LEDALRMNAQRVDPHLGELVRQSVEQAPHGLLEAEADQLCGAKRSDPGRSSRSIPGPGTTCGSWASGRAS